MKLSYQNLLSLKISRRLLVWFFGITLPISGLAQEVVNGFDIEGWIQPGSLKHQNSRLNFISGPFNNINSEIIQGSDSAIALFVEWDYPDNVENIIEFSGNELGQVTDYWIDPQTSDVFLIGGVSDPNQGVFRVGDVEVSQKCFIIRLNGDNELVWVREYPSVTPLRIEGDDDRIVIGGNLKDTLSFAGSNVWSIATDIDLPQNACVMVLGIDGEELWAKATAGDGREDFQDLGIDSDGNVVMCGHSDSNQLEFAGNIYSEGGFLCSYDDSGEENWLVNEFYIDEEYQGNTWIHSLEIDTDDNIYVVLSTEADEFVLNSETTSFECNPFSNRHEVIVKYSQEGNGIDFVNLGCHLEIDGDADIFLVNSQLIYAAHLIDDNHLEPFGINLGDDEVETMIISLNLDLAPQWGLLTSSPGFINTNFVSITGDGSSVFLTSLYQGQCTLDSYMLDSGASDHSYLFEIDLFSDISEYIRGQFFVYPNPATGEISLKFDDFGEDKIVRLIDSVGNVLHETQVSSSITTLVLSIEDYACGLYNLLVVLPDRTLAKTIVISH